MQRSLSWLTAACAAALTVQCPADVVELKDGTVLVGTVRRQSGTVEIVTSQGRHAVTEAQVARVRSSDELRAQWQLLAAQRPANDGFGQLALARLAREQGLAAEMWQAAERAAHAGATGVDTFLAGLGAEVLGADDRLTGAARARALLKRATGDGSIRDRAVVALLAHAPDSTPTLLSEGRTHWQGAVRRTAVAAIAQQLREAAATPRTDAAVVPNQGAPQAFLCLRTVVDPNPMVRSAAVAAVRNLDLGTKAVATLGPLMRHEAPEVRERTAEALGEIGNPGAVDYLITSLSGGGGSSARANVSFLEHTSYIRDFDVEVAQAATIADPVVGVVSSGVVLDAQVKGVSWERIVVERRVVGAAIQKLVGEAPPKDPARWQEWWDKLKAQRAGSNAAK